MDDREIWDENLRQIAQIEERMAREREARARTVRRVCLGLVLIILIVWLLAPSIAAMVADPLAGKPY
jgi:cell division septal protein FtsQ